LARFAAASLSSSSSHVPWYHHHYHHQSSCLPNILALAVGFSRASSPVEWLSRPCLMVLRPKGRLHHMSGSVFFPPCVISIIWRELLLHKKPVPERSIICVSLLLVLSTTSQAITVPRLLLLHIPQPSPISALFINHHSCLGMSLCPYCSNVSKPVIVLPRWNAITFIILVV
jgi:hypothetical protein